MRLRCLLRLGRLAHPQRGLLVPASRHVLRRQPVPYVSADLVELLVEVVPQLRHRPVEVLAEVGAELLNRVQ